MGRLIGGIRCRQIFPKLYNIIQWFLNFLYPSPHPFSIYFYKSVPCRVQKRIYDSSSGDIEPDIFNSLFAILYYSLYLQLLPKRYYFQTQHLIIYVSLPIQYIFPIKLKLGTANFLFFLPTILLASFNKKYFSIKSIFFILISTTSPCFDL